MYYKICEYCGKEFVCEDPRTRFCGRECGYENRRTIKGQNITHLRQYGIWIAIRDRCYNPKNEDYNRYGAKGIIVCEEWRNSFISFYEWSLKNGYNDNLSIDRIDYNGNYEPSNCRWADAETQNNNRSNNKIIMFKGKSQTIAQWSKQTGLSYGKIWGRMKKGLPVEQIFREVK